MILERRITPQESGMRLSRFLHGTLGMANGFISRLKPLNAFRVNGVVVHTDFLLTTGDLVQVDLAAPPPEFPPENGPLDILYEDEAILAVQKPPGLLVHPSRARLTGTLANRILGYYQATGQQCTVHILTRLDRDTQGVVLFSKNAYVHDILTRALHEGQVHKTYLAPVFGGPVADSGTWDGPIFRPDARAMLRCVDPAGQPALTQYDVLERHDGWSLLALRPVTGRTHQLRVHCLAADCPILGDPMYFTEASQAASAPLGWPYQHLLARQLTFPHPLTGEQLTLTAKIPADFLP
jgi:23S rRNA pseudouridine1911/1915/1917 synthase